MAKAGKGERPKGAGKKGGTRFPNYSLKQLLPNLKDLASKTHSKPITIQQLNAGVFKVGVESPAGQIRYSSLKQFLLAEGEYKNISSTDLTRSIVLASDEERLRHLRQAFFNVPSFKETFETFQGSTVNTSRIKSYCVSPLKIHLDLKDKFLESFLESAEVTNLCVVNGDDVTFINAKDVELVASNSEENGLDEDADNDLEKNAIDVNVEKEETQGDISPESKQNGFSQKVRPNRNLSNIGIQLDSHTDPEKLEQQLKVLRKYGLI